MRSIRRLLVVDDDVRLAHALLDALRGRAEVLHACGTVDEAWRLLKEWRPELAIVDVKLPDGTSVELLERCASLSPRPAIVAISGAAEASETFRLAELGVRAFLPKPLALPQLLQTIDAVLREAPESEPLVRNSVGRIGLPELQSRVRRAMVDEALQKSGGSRSGAARLLGVTRQALQNMLRRGP